MALHYGNLLPAFASQTLITGGGSSHKGDLEGEMQILISEGSRFRYTGVLLLRSFDVSPKVIVTFLLQQNESS